MQKAEQGERAREQFVVLCSDDYQLEDNLFELPLHFYCNQKKKREGHLLTQGTAYHHHGHTKHRHKLHRKDGISHVNNERQRGALMEGQTMFTVRQSLSLLI